MPPTPPASPSPLLLPANIPDMDIVLLPARAKPLRAPQAPPPIEATDDTYQIVYNRQLPDSTLEILALLIANKEAPPPLRRSSSLLTIPLSTRGTWSLH